MPIPYMCKQCGKRVEAFPSAIKRGSGKFCSKPCRALWDTLPLATRFRKFLGLTNDRGCLLWAGAPMGNGYGRIGRGGRKGGSILAHRASWELTYGPIPAGLCVLHRCDNRICVNPSHLFLGTIADNLADMRAKGRQHIGPRRSRRFPQERR
jgi:hypothetical protein